MGLCKCPKRKVTQQFCFEHKVNVCEFCMVSAHARCIVQSYLQWLEDSSYQPVCILCNQNLSSDTCVRLLCFHIFHWNCLDNHAKNLTANSSQSDSIINCPTCRGPLVPPNEVSSPLAEELRRLLSTAQWCRANLSRSFSTLNDSSKGSPGKNNLVEYTPKVITKMSESFRQSPPVVIPLSHLTNSLDCDDLNSVTNARKLNNSNHLHHHSHTTILDVDENKYRRRSVKESISKWLRSHKITVNGSSLSLKGTIFFVIIALFTVSMLLHYFLRMGRDSAEHDPLLDPRSNPHIKVSDN
ncbi:zinc finger protein-like 1 homolog [Brevipalpus obovatus]|uniref:zinc finger protein-like 1 homolog n=1 Tax=Brevipalpus obovatus TaxID=246614 RepID=UPI003D9F056D